MPPALCKQRPTAPPAIPPAPAHPQCEHHVPHQLSDMYGDNWHLVEQVKEIECRSHWCDIPFLSHGVAGRLKGVVVTWTQWCHQHDTVIVVVVPIAWWWGHQCHHSMVVLVLPSLWHSWGHLRRLGTGHWHVVGGTVIRPWSQARGIFNHSHMTCHACRFNDAENSPSPCD